jgi:hypothetical protein
VGRLRRRARALAGVGEHGAADAFGGADVFLRRVADASITALVGSDRGDDVFTEGCAQSIVDDRDEDLARVVNEIAVAFVEIADPVPLFARGVECG